ncbi:heavy-metal-associated domain-containing protein [Kocuria sp. SM24M-10]|uniref:heavy-metal-associated domain-containing protein n=1 Tax=Kocuria sp. SM24M-10 TaxID=1660349 RepID=UPI00069BBC4F|nr:heavy-metal-associated domain-containing protein [Kocuria sp. SM24M-10]
MTDALKITARPLPLVDDGGGCACCGPTPSTAEAAADAFEQHNPPAQIAVFEVEGMTCEHCVGRVTDAVKAVEGVRDVQVQLVPAGLSMVTVATDRLLLPATVRAAIEEAGYSVSGS